MLPKSKRFTKQDFSITRPKFFFRGELFDSAYYLFPTQKFACVIAKKTLKQAVERNLVKRRISSILEEIKPEKKYSIVIYPKKEVLKVPYSHLKEEIIKAFDTLH